MIFRFENVGRPFRRDAGLATFTPSWVVEGVAAHPSSSAADVRRPWQTRSAGASLVMGAPGPGIRCNPLWERTPF
jgi:hypothetical protein